MMMSFPLAAGGADLIFPAIFGLISLFAWISNVLKKNQEEQIRRNASQKRPKDQKVRREIEEFLQQQRTGRPSNRSNEVIETDFVEVVDESPNRRRPTPVVQPTKTPKANRKPAPQKSRAPTPSKTPPPQPQRSPVGNLSRAPLGADLREHVSQVMAERVKAQADRDLPHLASSVAEQVREDLGEFSVSKKATAPRSTAIPLIQMLSNPQTARQAVLMSEIMGRPKALRK
ncbi:MAG: hypothetical protein U0929_05340 [Planctomycetaceae bacterium]